MPPIKQLLSYVKSSTARDSLASLTGQITSGLLGAVFYAVAARSLGVSDFGLLSLAVATATIIKDIIDPGINALLLRFVPQQTDPASADSYIKYAALIKLGYFGLIIPPLIIFRRQIAFLIFKQPIFGLLPLTIALSLSFSLGFFISGILQSHRKFIAEAFFNFSLQIFRLVLIIPVIQANFTSTQSFLWANIVANFTISVVALFFLSTRFFTAKIHPRTKRDTRGFLPPLVISTATGTLTERFNLYLTNYFSSATQVGLLSSASQLFIPTRQIAGSLSNVFASRFSAYRTQAEAFLYLKKTSLLTFSLALGLISTSLFAQPIIKLIYGPDFIPAVSLFRLYTLAFGLFLVQVPSNAFLLYFQGRSGFIAVLSFIQLFATVIAGLLFIPRFQALGAVLSFLFVTLLSLAIQVLVILFTQNSKPAPQSS